MAQQIITRLRPADLQEVQVQTANNAAVTDVITALQAGKSTEQAPLNTLCPSCSANNAQKGYLPFTWKGKDYHFLCTTCKGYALVYTVGGQLTPPVNPFNAPLVVTRLLPSDLIEAMVAFPNSTTLDLLITSLQGNVPDGAPVLLYDCGLCSATGWITANKIKIICPTCAGYQKTVSAIPYVRPTNPVVKVPTSPSNT